LSGPPTTAWRSRAAAAAEVLRERFILRGGAFGLTTDAFDSSVGGLASGTA
jgi:hypothetical protein